MHFNHRPPHCHSVYFILEIQLTQAADMSNTRRSHLFIARLHHTSTPRPKESASDHSSEFVAELEISVMTFGIAIECYCRNLVENFLMRFFCPIREGKEIRIKALSWKLGQ